MGNIQEQIKALQRKQALIETYQLLLNYQVIEVKEHPGIQQEVTEAIKKFVETKVSEVEDEGKTQGSPLPPQGFSAQEVSVLKNLANRVVSRGEDSSMPSATQLPNAQPTSSRDTTGLKHPDKISFALKYRHLENKKIKFDSPHGPVTGTVVALDSPNALIHTDTGHRVAVDILKITEA